MAIISSDGFNVPNEGVERQNRKKLPYKCKFNFGFFFDKRYSGQVMDQRIATIA